MARRETAKRHSLQSFIADQVISNVSRFSHFVNYLKHRSPKPFGKYCCHCPCLAVVAPYDHYGHKSETVFERCRLKIHSSEREVTETNDFMLSLLHGLSLESQLRNPFPGCRGSEGTGGTGWFHLQSIVERRSTVKVSSCTTSHRLRAYRFVLRCLLLLLLLQLSFFKIRFW